MPNILINPNSRIIEFSTGIAGGSGTQPTLSGALLLSYDNLGGINLASYATGTLSSGLDRFSIDGSAGRLFSVTDSVNGSLLSVNDGAGLPIFEVFDDNRIIAGEFNRNDFIISGNSIGIGGIPFNTGITKLFVSGNVDISGESRVSGQLVATHARLLETGLLLNTRLNTTGTNLHNLLNTTGTNLHSLLQTTGVNLSGGLVNLRDGAGTFVRIDNTTQNISGNKIFLGDVTIRNLTVTGTQSVTSTQTVSVGSNFMIINSGEPGPGITNLSGGFVIDRGTGNVPDAVFYYSEQRNRFEFGRVDAISGVASEETLATTINNLNSTGNLLLLRSLGLTGELINSGFNLFTRDENISGRLIVSGKNLLDLANAISLGATTSGGYISGELIKTGFNLNTYTTLVETLVKTGFVPMVGAQSIAGEKNFLSLPKVSGYKIITEVNIADQTNLVFTTGNQTITGVKNFNLIPTVNSIPMLVSGTYGTLDLESRIVSIPNGLEHTGIRFLRNYSVPPVVTSNIYFTGVTDDIISCQIQNTTSTGFTLSLSRPSDGHSISYMAFENTGIGFLALGSRSFTRGEFINLNANITTQNIVFPQAFATLPEVVVSIEDRNVSPTNEFLVYKVQNLTTGGFIFRLQNATTETGYFIHYLASI